MGNLPIISGGLEPCEYHPKTEKIASLEWWGGQKTLGHRREMGDDGLETSRGK